MKKIITIVFLSFISVTILGCNEVMTNPYEEYCELTDTDGVYVCEKTSTSYFDTTILLKIYYTENDSYQVNDIFDYFLDTLETYHQLFDKYNEYEDINNVYSINQLNLDEKLVLDDILFEAIEYALDNQDLVVAEDTELFNIALNPVLNVWHNARGSDLCDSNYELGILWCPVPYDEINDISFNTNSDDIVLDSDNQTISFVKADMGIDLGGFGKGYVSGVIADYLDELDITYLLNAGNSNIIANNSNPTRDTGLYYIALIEPEVDFHIVNNYYQYIKIPENISVVTSGNYQRYFKEIDTGDVYHHIIDPRTNYPGGDCMSVTVIYPDSALADIYSTAIYLLTVEEGLDFVNNTLELEAVWYGYDGKITYSNGFSVYDYDMI